MLALTLSLLSTLACPTLSADSVELIPETATMVVGGDVGRIVGTRIGSEIPIALEADLEAGEALRVLDKCGLALDDVGEVWLARDAGEGRLLFIEASNIGEAETLDCIAKQLRARDQGREPWTASADGCNGLELRDGSRAWPLGANALIWARGPMIEEIEEIEEVEKFAEVEAAKRSPLTRDLDRRAHLWLAMTLDRVRWAPEARSLVAAIDLEHDGHPGLWADFAFTVDDLASAAALRDRMLGVFVQIAERLDGLGIRHRLRERARVGVVGSSLAGTLELDWTELEQIHAQLAGASLL